jgi:hypothetical protein
MLRRSEYAHLAASEIPLGFRVPTPDYHAPSACIRGVIHGVFLQMNALWGNGCSFEMNIIGFTLCLLPNPEPPAEERGPSAQCKILRVKQGHS